MTTKMRANRVTVGAMPAIPDACLTAYARPSACSAARARSRASSTPGMPLAQAGTTWVLSVVLGLLVPVGALWLLRATAAER